MCGIAGQITMDRRPVDGRTVAAMGARLRHRGPDDHGLHVKGHVGLAHRRLSILDVSAAGHQPMSNDAGTVWIVLNGEIYNYGELRGRLRSPRAFRSRTDTEVLLYLYEDHGLRCLEMLRGMFAVAIWDERSQRLLLARDRLGKKPLFYSLRNRTLSFASELKALLADGPRPDLDPVALHHYLTFQYVPAPQTIYRDVHKLLPGHALVYEDGKITDSAYWTLSYGKEHARRTDGDYREEFLALLTESVRLRLVSDVPLGAFLSGGVDSSSVVALMSRLSNRPVRTFSIGFKEEAFNELPHARRVADQFATDHHEFVVEPSAVEILPELAQVYDEPFADSSAIPTYYLAQLTRRFVTVALNGDGGDELLGGYPRYRFEEGGRLPASLLSDRTRARLQDLLARLPGSLPGADRLRSRLGPLLTPVSRTYLRRICYFAPDEKDALYTDGFRGSVRAHDSLALLDDWFGQAPAPDLLDRLLAVDTRSYLPDDLLVKVDRATMAHGLEARSPLLDHRLVEFAASLPVDLKVRGGEGKHLLKSAMRDLLPEPVVTREKMGFAVPLDRWYRSECRDFVRDTLLSARSLQRGYFQPSQLRALLDTEQGGACTYGARVHALLMLELWHREYMDGPPCDAEPAGAR
jgi:asparagine synthase (glutamine-hydrolysing)